jgi:stage II sporulation protein D
MSVGRAQAKLNGLVKGRLRSVKVTKRGVSPRIVSAQVVGTRGSTTVTGATLRARFGLNDTWAYFSFVGTKARRGGTAPARKSGDPGTGTGGASARTAAFRRGGVVSGYVSSARDGSKVAIQRRTRAGVWIVELRTTVGRNGEFRATVNRTGTYRVKAGRVVGPLVRIR